MEIFNVYCDESCHLEKDHQKAMVLGAIWCPLEKCREVSVRLREIKKKHGLPSDFEVKWTKISPAKSQFYLEWMDYFFDDDDLHFRALPGLRHVYASMLASSGQVDLYTLQKLLTHRSSAMTVRHAHLRDEALRNAANLAGNLIEQLANGAADLKKEGLS